MNTRVLRGGASVVDQGGASDWRHFIQVQGRTVAVYSRQSSGTNTLRYLLSDHLGSAETIASSTGSVIVRETFDAFGKRRGTNWTGNPTSGDLATIDGITRRGYTAHEMLDSTDLIHMNGRVQDPMLGRFISADPYIDGAMNTQGWNRYAYLKNNPVALVDPTGFND
jgi:RHS repeat-associated protein